MKYIEDIEIDNKKVILRLDYNVTIKDGKIIDDTKIRKSIPTIKYLLNKNCHVLIMSHLGKIKSENDKRDNSLKIVCEHLAKLLNMNVNFISTYQGDELSNSLKQYALSMMENTRFADYPLNLESGCDLKLAKYWASLADVFVNDAFGTTHRKHASNYGIAKYLPSVYGFLINEELMGLEPLVKNIAHPFVVIMGGAKVDDKIKLIESLVQECDYLLVGGGIANTFLKATHHEIGSSLYSVEYVEDIAKILHTYENKIIIPDDVYVLRDGKKVKTTVNEILNDDKIYDIGSETIEKYGNYLKKARTIFVNGTMGYYEDRDYREGTENLYRLLNNLDAIKIAGGGDAVSSVNSLGYKDAFDFLSTGGGATLDYLANKKLKCFEER